MKTLYQETILLSSKICTTVLQLFPIIRHAPTYCILSNEIIYQIEKYYYATKIGEFINITPANNYPIAIISDMFVSDLPYKSLYKTQHNTKDHLLGLPLPHIPMPIPSIGKFLQ